jgi:MFS family permease
MTLRNKQIFGTLFFSIFTAVTGVGIVVPLLPVYAMELGARGIYIGMIFGAFSLSRSFFLPYFGRLSDRKGRKPFIVTGLLAYALVSLAFMWTDRVVPLIYIRFLQGIASAMLMPVSQAYIGDITPKGREGFTMGLFNVSMFFGLSIGPILGGLINDQFSLHVAFGCMGVLSVIGFALSLIFLPSLASERHERTQQIPAGWSTLAGDRSVIALFLVRFAYAASIGVIWGFLPVLAAMELGLTSTPIGMLITLGIFISGLLHMPMGALADRISRTAMVLTGGTIISGSVLAFTWCHTLPQMLMASIGFGIGGGIAMPSQMALAVVTGHRTHAMGAVMGLLTLAHSLGMLAGSVMAGTMMDVYSLRSAFPPGALLMLASIVCFPILFPKEDAAIGKRPVDPEIL